MPDEKYQGGGSRSKTISQAYEKIQDFILFEKKTVSVDSNFQFAFMIL